MVTRKTPASVDGEVSGTSNARSSGGVCETPVAPSAGVGDSANPGKSQIVKDEYLSSFVET